MQIVKNCSNCYYAKNDDHEKNKKFCIVKKEIVSDASSCGYFLKNYDMPVSRTG